jgi:hypothetical protein
MQLPINGLPAKFLPSLLSPEAGWMNRFCETALPVPPIVCWHHSPDEYGDIGMGGGAMGGAGAGDASDEPRSASGAGATRSAATGDEDRDNEDTGLDPMQGGVDFEAGGNLGGPDDTGGIDVNALNTGTTGESNPADGNATPGEEENAGRS